MRHGRHGLIGRSIADQSFVFFKQRNFTMAERKSFSFIDFLDQAVCDLIGDGAELQIVCYFRSTYEVLIDADERLSELLSPADLLTHLRVLVHLPSSQLVPILKYLVCWPIAKWLRQEMPEVPEGIPPEIFGSPLNLFSNGRLGPRRHLKNLISSRTNNRRALRVTWCWLQGAKRGLPEIPPEFILASKLKHAIRHYRSSCRRLRMNILLTFSENSKCSGTVFTRLVRDTSVTKMA